MADPVADQFHGSRLLYRFLRLSETVCLQSNAAVLPFSHSDGVPGAGAAFFSNEGAEPPHLHIRKHAASALEKWHEHFD